MVEDSIAIDKTSSNETEIQEGIFLLAGHTNAMHFIIIHEYCYQNILFLCTKCEIKFYTKCFFTVIYRMLKIFLTFIARVSSPALQYPFMSIFASFHLCDFFLFFFFLPIPEQTYSLIYSRVPIIRRLIHRLSRFAGTFLKCRIKPSLFG